MKINGNVNLMFGALTVAIIGLGFCEITTATTTESNMQTLSQTEESVSQKSDGSIVVTSDGGAATEEYRHELVKKAMAAFIGIHGFDTDSLTTSTVPINGIVTVTTQISHPALSRLNNQGDPHVDSGSVPTGPPPPMPPPPGPGAVPDWVDRVVQSASANGYRRDTTYDRYAVPNAGGGYTDWSWFETDDHTTANGSQGGCHGNPDLPPNCPKEN